MLIRLTVVTIPKHILISNHVVYLKLISCYMSITSQLKKKPKLFFPLKFPSVLLSETFSRSPLNQSYGLHLNYCCPSRKTPLHPFKCVHFSPPHHKKCELGSSQQSLHFQRHRRLTHKQILHMEASFAVFHSALTRLSRIR